MYDLAPYFIQEKDFKLHYYNHTEDKRPLNMALKTKKGMQYIWSQFLAATNYDYDDWSF